MNNIAIIIMGQSRGAGLPGDERIFKKGLRNHTE